MIYYFFFNMVGILVPAFFVRTLWRNWHLPVALPLTLFISLVVSICIVSLFGMSQFIGDIVVHQKIALILGFSTTPLWFWVTYEYIKKKKLALKYVILIIIEPLLAIVFFLTNDMHGLFYSVAPSLTSDSVNINQSAMTVLSKTNLIYSLAMISFSLAWLVFHLFKHSNRSVLELTILTVILCSPAVSYVLFAHGHIAVRVGAPLSIVLILLAMYRFKILDIIPIARDQIIDQIKDGVAIINNDGKVVEANASAMQLLELQNDSQLKVATPLDWPENLKNKFDFTSAQRQASEIDFSELGYSIEHAEVELSCLLDNDQQRIGNILFLRDISDRKRAEQERELHINQIEKSQIELEKLDQLKSEFLANISHEFRTPLTLSLGPIKDIIDGIHGDTSNQVNQQLISVLKHNQSLLDLINQLLDLSKLESTEISDNTKIVDWVQYIPVAMSGFEEIAKKQNIQFNFETTLEKAPINMVNDHIDKIINNLLSNAFKSCQKDDEININLNLFDETTLEIKVTDTGCGISEEMLPNIFKRFYYSEHQNKNWSASTGIGLALVKQLILNHGGSISVQSEVNKGSIFSIRLPISQNVMEPQESNNTINELSSVQAFSHEIENQNEKNVLIDEQDDRAIILVVEDNQDMRKYICSHLTKSYQLIEASNGSEGFELAKKYVPDIIISDVMMPIVGGLELCKMIKSEIKTSHIPVILLTAKSDVNDKMLGLDVEADDYLTKPFNQDLLKARVSNLIKQRIKLGKIYSQIISNDFESDKPANKKHAQQIKTLLPLETDFLNKFLTLVKQNIPTVEITIVDLAKLLFISERQLQRKIKNLTGKTPKQWLLEVRLQYATELLKNSPLNITQIVEKTGFSTSAYFSKKFKQVYNKSPSDYRLNI